MSVGPWWPTDQTTPVYMCVCVCVSLCVCVCVYVCTCVRVYHADSSSVCVYACQVHSKWQNYVDIFSATDNVQWHDSLWHNTLSTKGVHTLTSDHYSAVYMYVYQIMNSQECTIMCSSLLIFFQNNNNDWFSCLYSLFSLVAYLKCEYMALVQNSNRYEYCYD